MKPAAAFLRTLVLAGLGLADAFAPAFGQSEPAVEPAVRAVAQAMPAVVNINTERIVRLRYQDPYDAFFHEFFGGPMRRPRELRQTVQSLGSGFLVDKEGYIVTNEHVVERAEDLKIQVTLSDGTSYEAKYVSGDPSSDLAFIKIDAKKPLPFIDLHDISPNLLGQTVLALGNPLGYGSSVSRGILSATNRTITINEVEFADLLQTDAAINPGNSGGPLIDLAGKLVGVNSVKMAFTPQGVPTQGLGFAVPAAKVRERVAQFRRDAAKPKEASTAAKKRFGLQVQELSDDLREAFGYPAGRGVLVADVDAEGPAAKAGLRRGFVIYKVGRYEINAPAEFEELLQRVEPGSVADFEVGTVRRGSSGELVPERRSLSVTAR